MDVSDSVRSATELLSGRPTHLLPMFLAATGSVLVSQVVVILGGVAAYLTLHGTGRLEQFFESAGELAEQSQAAAESGGEPSAGFAGQPGGEGISNATIEAFTEAVAGLFTPEVVVILLVAGVVAFVLGVVVRGVATAGTTHTAVSAVFGDPALADGVRGVGRDWRAFVGFAVLKLLLVAVPTVLLVGGSAALGTVNPALGFLAILLGSVVWLVVVLGGYLAVLFVPQAIAVEGVGLREGVRYSIGFVRAEAGRALGYVVVAIGAWVLFGIASGVLSVLGVGRLASLVIGVAVAPWLALVKAGVYVDTRPPAVDGDPALLRFRAAFERGFGALRRFVVGHPGSLAGCTAVFGGGVVGGYLVAAPYSLGLGVPDDPASVFGSVPLDTFLNIAANNWLVAVSQAFAGLALGIPTLSNLLFNGLLVGFVVGFGYGPVVGAAFILPHGLLEVPALLVSGALGLSLGRSVWDYRGGRLGPAELATDMREALFVLLGLAPVFLVAAAIEAFVTPWVVTLVT